MNEVWSIARRSWDRIGRVVGRAWEDRASRSCLIVVVASLWFMLTLTEPAFLVVFVASLFGLWVLGRSRRRLLADQTNR